MSKVILHPTSQNFLVATNDECDRPGRMCVSVISCGSHGISRLHVCVEWMNVPSGSLILSGFEVVCSFFTAAPFIMKCAVAPESRMAYSVGLVSLVVLSSSEDSSSSVSAIVEAVALSHSCLCKQFDITTVSSSSSSPCKTS